jgi:hypothetical protein
MVLLAVDQRTQRQIYVLQGRLQHIQIFVAVRKCNVQEFTDDVSSVDSS